MLSEEAIRGLTELDAEVIIDFVERQPTLRELAQKRGLASPGTPGDKGGLLDFLAWWHSPPIAAALEGLLRFHALRRELRHGQLREELIALLAQVAKTSTSPVEQRRAATTALGAMATPARRGEARRGYGRSGPAQPRARRAADARDCARNGFGASWLGGGFKVEDSPGRGGGAPIECAPLHDTASEIDDDERSGPRGSDLRGRRGPASHVAAAPPSPPGRGVSPQRSAGETVRAPSSTATTQPRRSVTHTAHTATPNHNGGFKGGAAPTNSAFTTPLVSLSRSIPFSAPVDSTPRASDPPAPPSPSHRITESPSHSSPDPDDAACDADLDDDDPEGTLAIAHHVLETVKSDPGAYSPEAIHAAQVYISLSPDAASESAPTCESPPPPDTS